MAAYTKPQYQSQSKFESQSQELLLLLPQLRMGFVKLYLNLYPHWLQFRTPNPAPQFFGLSKFRTCLAGSLILSLVGERIHFAWLMDMKIKPKIHLHLHPSSRVPLLQRHLEKKCFKKVNQT